MNACSCECDPAIHLPIHVVPAKLPRQSSLASLTFRTDSEGACMLQHLPHPRHAETRKKQHNSTEFHPHLYSIICLSLVQPKICLKIRPKISPFQETPNIDVIYHWIPIISAGESSYSIHLLHDQLHLMIQPRESLALSLGMGQMDPKDPDFPYSIIYIQTLGH